MKKQGFTLVEMAIVLFIIGLLAASVLIGRELIMQARIRATISQYEQYNTALNTFRLKYDCVAGDCPFATKLFGQSTQCGGSQPLGLAETCDGSGDGKVVWITPTMEHAEMFLVWQHLSRAGLIPGNYTGKRGIGLFPASSKAGENTPPSVFGDNTCWSYIYTSHPTQEWNYHYAMFPQKDANMLIIGNPWGTPGDPMNPDPNNPWHTTGGYENPDYCWQGAFAPSVAYAMDSKLDDGRPGLGKIRAWRDRNLLCRTTGDENTSEYNKAEASAVCGLLMSVQ